jgi:hypothetical protein
MISSWDCCRVWRVVNVRAKIKWIAFHLLLIIVCYSYWIVTLAISLLIIFNWRMVRMINNLLISSICVHIPSRNSYSWDYFTIWTYRSSSFLYSSEIIFELLLQFLILILLSGPLIYWTSSVQPIFTIFWSDWFFMVVRWIWRRNQIFKLWSLRIVIIGVSLSIKEPCTPFPWASSHILRISPNWVIFRWLRPSIRQVSSYFHLFRVI